MREISGGDEPPVFTEWKLKTPGMGYNNLSAEIRGVLKQALVDEQRGLCAYTGIRIHEQTSHVEHLIPQEHCAAGQDITYRNMVACYPGPGAHADFGAVKKRNWPSLAEQHLFVSPRSRGCESRFAFRLTGRIFAAGDNDEAAELTIQKLGLGHRLLDQYRKEAIDATLEVRGRGPASLDLHSAKKRLRQLERAEQAPGILEPFCFVLKQAIKRHIMRLEAVIRSKKNK
ncbi:MAG TPA: hypothetical protein VNH11_15960 [Pirellulales bacterium]|nr:hypothetical protein [Pirellulales bacterium]